MISGLPRPAMAGSARRAPASASLRISGTGLISLFIGENPDTIIPRSMRTGNERVAIVSAAVARMPAGNASRRANASRAQFGFG